MNLVIPRGYYVLRIRLISGIKFVFPFIFFGRGVVGALLAISFGVIFLSLFSSSSSLFSFLFGVNKS